MSSRTPLPSQLLQRPDPRDVVPGSVPGGGYRVYRGSGQIGEGGRVETDWQPVEYDSARV